MQLGLYIPFVYITGTLGKLDDWFLPAITLAVGSREAVFSSDGWLSHTHHLLASLEGAALLLYQLSHLQLCCKPHLTRALADIACRPSQGWGDFHFSSDWSPGPVLGAFVKRDLGAAEAGKEEALADILQKSHAMKPQPSGPALAGDHAALV